MQLRARNMTWGLSCTVRGRRGSVRRGVVGVRFGFDVSLAERARGCEAEIVRLTGKDV
jgi:hypothetical protein